MIIFGYKIEKVKAKPTLEDIKRVILEKTELNATQGVIQGKLDLTLHELLLEKLEIKLPANEEEKETLEREISLTKDAIERDKKTINNWETQLQAVKLNKKTGETMVVDGLELVFKLPSEAYKNIEPIEPTELYAITAFKNK